MRARGIEEDQVEAPVDHGADRPALAPQFVAIEMLEVELEARIARGTASAAGQVLNSIAPPRTRKAVSSMAAISGAVMSERNFGT